MAALTLEEFRATREWKSEGWDDVGLETPGYVYGGTCFICKCDDGSYWLPIENREYASSDLSELEEKLYTNWYLPEARAADDAAEDEEDWRCGND